MKEQHLSEDLLQRHVMEHIPLDTAARAHLEKCPVCRLQAETYQLVLKGLVCQEQPALDIDLAAAVLTKLPAPKPASEGAFLAALVTVVIALAAFIIVGMQLDFGFLKLTAGPIFSGIILLTALGSLMFILAASWGDFRHKIDMLHHAEMQQSGATSVK